MWKILLLNACMAASYPLSQKALGYAHPALLIATRMLIAGALFSSYAFFKKRPNVITQGTWKDWLHVIYIGVGAMCIPFFLECWSLTQVSALHIAAIYSLAPLIAALIEYYFAHRAFTYTQISALIIGVAGGIIMVAFGNSSTGLSCDARMLLPMAAILIGIAFTAHTWFSVVELLHKGYSLSTINGATMLVGSLAGSLVTLFVWPTTSVISASWTQLVADATLVALLGSVMGCSLFGPLALRYGYTFMALAQCSCPLLTMLYAYLTAGTIPTFFECTGLGLIISAIFLFYK